MDWDPLEGLNLAYLEVICTQTNYTYSSMTRAAFSMTAI